MATNNKPYVVECEENWDDCNDPTYNPEENIKNKLILRKTPINLMKTNKPKQRKKDCCMIVQQWRHYSLVCKPSTHVTKLC